MPPFVWLKKLCLCDLGDVGQSNRVKLALQAKAAKFCPKEYFWYFWAAWKTLKCLWSKKWLLLIWKAFQSKEWRFSFWNIVFRYGYIYNTQSRIFVEILKQCSSNLASEANIIKEGKWHLSCCCHDNRYAAGPVLIKTKIPRFHLKQGSSTPNNLMGES